MADLSAAFPAERIRKDFLPGPASAVLVQGAGRTDAGVHALGQVVQMELPALPARRIREALNYHMKPHPVVVLRAVPAESFNQLAEGEPSRTKLMVEDPARPRGVGVGSVGFAGGIGNGGQGVGALHLT